MPFSQARMRPRFSVAPLSGVAGLLLCCFLLVSCASPPAGTMVNNGIPQVENQIRPVYIRDTRSEEQRPAWIMQEPDDQGELHYLVGLSNYHASEQEARSDALRYAREEYAKYTGVDVAVVDEVIRALYGRESEILDATVGSITQSTQTTDAQVSRIKPKHWYSETYRVNRQERDVGMAWKYWVLVTVPVDEIDRVQAWRRDQLAKAERRAEEALQINLDRVRETLRLARMEVEAGNIIPASNRIQQDWNYLYGEIQRFKDGDSHFKARAGKLEQAQKGLIGEIGVIRSRLFIDTGRFSTQTVTLEGGSGKVRVWVWLRSEKKLQPVSGLPLLLTDETGRIVARTTCGPTGRAEFLVGEVPAGRYRVSVDAESGPLSLLGKEMCQALAMLDNRLSLLTAEEDMAGAARAAVHTIFDGPALQDLPVRSVVFAPVTYGETRLPTGFGRALQQIIRQQLTSIEGLAVIEPQSRDVRTVSETVRRVRGIGLRENDSTVEDQEPTNLGSAAMQAAIDGAEAGLEVTYTVQNNNEVWAAMKLKAAGSDRLIEAATAVITQYSPGLDLYPQAVRESRPLTSFQGDIKLEVTSHLGDGRTYQEGEVVTFFVSTDRDAYLLLIYEDAVHNLIQILPNQYSGNGFFRRGNLMGVPGPNDRFEFVIQAPFGVEYLRAFASATPFPVLPGEVLPTGLVVLNLTLDSVTDVVRAHGGKPGNHYGEAETVITTVAGRD
ncbi:MAG: DUF4384 domain-containing protein [Proteobacteria bacterium]|nr:DUF4384 domain-containing protein [Pseudomonadota bacterium]MBU1687897.1 DUF4384 domain-containing protein [Pseudomonadota bacterium]